MRIPQAATEPRLTFVSIATPFQRIAEVPGWGWMSGVLAGAVHVVRTDLFAGALVLLIIASAIDYWFGRRVAKETGGYVSSMARAGALGKLSAIALLILVRLFEYWAAQHVVLSTQGFLATALAVGLFALEVESIAHHREALGARPIPLLSTVIDIVRSVAERLVPRPRDREDSER